MAATVDEAAKCWFLRAHLDLVIDEILSAWDGLHGPVAREVRAKAGSYRRVLMYWDAVVPTHAQQTAVRDLVLQLRDVKLGTSVAAPGSALLEGRGSSETGDDGSPKTSSRNEA